VAENCKAHLDVIVKASLLAGRWKDPNNWLLAHDIQVRKPMMAVSPTLGPEFQTVTKIHGEELRLLKLPFDALATKLQKFPDLLGKVHETMDAHFIRWSPKNPVLFDPSVKPLQWLGLTIIVHKVQT
jgi:hypothetical protein